MEERIYVQYSCSRPLHHKFQMGALFAWPTVARDGKSIIYLSLKKIKIRGTTAPKSQDRLKRLLPEDSTGGFVVSKALIPQP